MLDLSESGGDIAEKLFVLLDEKQQKELTSYVITRNIQDCSFSGSLPDFGEKEVVSQENFVIINVVCPPVLRKEDIGFFPILHETRTLCNHPGKKEYPV